MNHLTEKAEDEDLPSWRPLVWFWLSAPILGLVTGQLIVWFAPHQFWQWLANIVR